MGFCESVILNKNFFIPEKATSWHGKILHAMLLKMAMIWETLTDTSSQLLPTAIPAAFPLISSSKQKLLVTTQTGCLKKSWVSTRKTCATGQMSNIVHEGMFI